MSQKHLNIQPDGDDRVPPLSHSERLLARIVDGEATDAEWAQFRSMANAEFAGAERSAWRDLAEAQRQHGLLSAAVGAEVFGVERVRVGRRAAHGLPRPVVGRSAGAFGALAVAAVLLLGLSLLLGDLVRLRPGSEPSPGAPQMAGLYRIDTPEDAVRAYLDKGRETGQVIDEVPMRVLVESRPIGDGRRYEVVYLRQFVERAEISDVYRLAADESGGVMGVPVVTPAVYGESY